ncbi:Down syndrome cell adhesion molecule homolog [Paramuricea clavata]|uniref:Down syndrome cell adhesion molecule homolog, partial n=1 Tax=Paramuricea clavata TaxID=317549 RepID=A0A7D9DGW4_PARCT|nr:Down syndrome cell adhesion molecule homolog [Paramuricea clavata]
MLTSQRKLLMHIIVIAFAVFHASRSEKPVIVKRPISQNVYLNKSATFVCRVQSTLPFAIEWTKDGGQLLKSVRGSLLIFNDSLTFLHARRSDDGIYKCTANNSVGSSSSEATLTVLDPPVEPTITEISSNQTIVEGVRVTFTCKATGNPLPHITWKRFLESGDAAQLERPSPQSIRISSASPRDAGQYVCIAENDSGKDTETVYLNVLGYPIFIVSPRSNITIPENKTVSLNCKVIGSPVPDVNWYYGNKLADEISNIVVLDNNTIQISNVKFDNSGSYTCMANNSVGLQRSRNTLLQVLRKPKLDCCPNKLTAWRNETAIEGQSTSLNCSAAGYPKLEYQWMFENKTVSSFSVFTISSVSRRNHGVYSCMVHNNLGEVMLMVYLNVLVPPEVSVQPQQATVVKGEHVEFSCTATGVPLPVVTWYSSRGLVLRNNTLVIANVSKNDQGEYLCEAKNNAGQKTVGTRVTVAGMLYIEFTFVPLPQGAPMSLLFTLNR